MHWNWLQWQNGIFFNNHQICFLWSTLGKGVLIFTIFQTKKQQLQLFSKLYSRTFVFSANVSWVGYYFLCPLVLFINLFWDCWFCCGAKFLELCPLFWVSEWDFLASVVSNIIKVNFWISFSLDLFLFSQCVCSYIHNITSFQEMEIRMDFSLFFLETTEHMLLLHAWTV